MNVGFRVAQPNLRLMHHFRLDTLLRVFQKSNTSSISVGLRQILHPFLLWNYNQVYLDVVQSQFDS